MACANTHKLSTTAQGPGVCCASMPAGVTPTVGERWAAKDKKGHCFVCEIKASTSQKHPGRLVIKRGKACEGNVCLCPTSTGGCCRLLAAA